MSTQQAKKADEDTKTTNPVTSSGKVTIFNIELTLLLEIVENLGKLSSDSEKFILLMERGPDGLYALNVECNNSQMKYLSNVLSNI